MNRPNFGETNFRNGSCGVKKEVSKMGPGPFRSASDSQAANRFFENKALTQGLEDSCSRFTCWARRRTFRCLEKEAALS